MWLAPWALGLLAADAGFAECPPALVQSRIVTGPCYTSISDTMRNSGVLFRGGGEESAASVCYLS